MQPTTATSDRPLAVSILTLALLAASPCVAQQTAAQQTQQTATPQTADAPPADAPPADAPPADAAPADSTTTASDDASSPIVTDTGAAQLAADTTADTAADEELAAQVRQRQEIATIHRAFGIATWISMATTAVLGWITFADQYGFHGSENQTACAAGHAVFQDFCVGTPWPHAIAGFTTTALYFTTAGLSFAMPSPLPRSADVELHATLRWIHLAGMIALAGFGLVAANVDADFSTRQILAGIHEGLAVTTFGVLTAAAAIVVF